MNNHDLSDLNQIARTLRHHYGSQMICVDPKTNKKVNIVLLMEDVVAYLNMEQKAQSAPRARHYKGKAFMPNAEHVTVTSSRTMGGNEHER